MMPHYISVLHILMEVMTIDKIAGEWYVEEACVKPGSVDTYYSCYIYHLSLIIGDREAEDLREEELLRIFRGFKDKKRGLGVILCLIDKKTYLRENLVALPISYI